MISLMFLAEDHIIFWTAHLRNTGRLTLVRGSSFVSQWKVDNSAKAWKKPCAPSQGFEIVEDKEG